MPRIAKRTAARVQIEIMVKRIVKKFHPQKIILFGSHGRGEAGPDSDIQGRQGVVCRQQRPSSRSFVSGSRRLRMI